MFPNNYSNIFQTNISLPFAYVYFADKERLVQIEIVKKLYLNEKQRKVQKKKILKNISNNLNSHIVNNETNPDIVCKNFMEFFFSAYETIFPEIEIKNKATPFSNQSLTKRIKKSSKKKQKLHETFLQRRNKGNEKTYKTSKKFFETTEKIF